MASRKSRPPRSSRLRRLLPWAAPPLALVALAATQLGEGAPAAATSQPAPRYSALAGSEPTGLTFVDPHATGSPAGASGPTWPASPPEDTGGSWPVTSSIRRVTLSVPGISAWIARSAAGGVCVLVYDGRAADGVGVTCSTPEGVGAGASLEITELPEQPGRVIEAGVVPDGVTAVRATLADGTSTTMAVSGNAWARSGSEPSAPGSETTAITGG